MKTNDHKRQSEKQDERYKYAYLCVEQLEESKDQEVDHQAGKKSLLEVSADDDMPRVVSKKEIQYETQAVSEEGKEENCHYQPKERNWIKNHQM